MAGPGGGSSGGGGFGGGSFGGGGGFSGGGGFGGGSFGGNFGGNHNGGSFGGHHHGHHHHGTFFGGPFFGRRRTYVGGGCGGALFTVIVISMFAFFALVWFFGEPSDNNYIDENGIAYDEGSMQDYADMRYKEAFGDYEGYEDNILLVFLANEEADGYYTIAWVGDNVKSEINEMFGEYTEYGEYMNQYINTNYYGYTLDNNLADVVAAMENSIVSANLGSSFRSEAAVVSEKTSGIKNYTQFEISKDIVNNALTSFTESTGIPVVIVVDMAEKVFGSDNSVVIFDDDGGIVSGDNVKDSVNKEYNPTTVGVALLALGVAAVVIIAAVALMKNKRLSAEKKADESKNDMPWES